ncbi:MAG: toxin-antitoxin system HicB family antitoxin [Gemmatimonadetes bacterium]|nr:toxin-antitoxin system HicB family antitoxin [Gemmatimonadota bacterium]
MSTMSIQLPESLHKQVQELAEQEGISLEYFVALAVAEKMASLRTVEYLRERGARGSREKFEAILAKVPDVEPEEYDRL